jgi:GNAT superfamily N-acetyltransferase
MIRIRKATREDGQAAWDVRREAVLSQCTSMYPLELLTAWTSNGPSANWIDVVAKSFWVAVDGDEVVATCMLTIETGKVDAIFVRPSHMKRGVGAFVMQFVETMARRHGIAMLTLEATLNAAPFYRRCGFTGDRIEKYRSPRGLALDCIPMVKQLDGPGLPEPQA